jgi:hypothetical protein
MYSIDNRVGKLVEIRIWSPVSVGEATLWGRDHDAVVNGIVGQYVCFVDLVEATVFPQDVVDTYIGTMKNEPRLLRTATLLGASPTLGLQIQRMLREANSPERKAFREPRELEAWLGVVLTQQERARLRELVDRRAEAFGPSSAPQSAPASLRPPKSTRGTPSLRPPPNGRPSGRDD